MSTRRSGSRLAAALLATVSLGVTALADEEVQPGARWGADWFPNVPLTDHEGREVRFFDDLVEGKVVVINFIYTTCPDSCPLETARLREVQQILGDRVGEDVFFYSITIDPERDTPEVLAEYAERYQVGPGWWFLTGEEEDITSLRKKLGLYIAEIQDGSNDHNLSMVMGNQASGRWRKASPFENPYVLASQVGGWLNNWEAPRTNELDYASAPGLREISKGESVFRTRCAVCHSIETDPIQRVGPDLLGVTERRDRGWLERWIAEPDQMLAEGDPLAAGLFEAFNRVPMPNLRLNERDVRDVIEYLEAETRRVRALKEAGIEGAPRTCCLKQEQTVLDGETDTAPVERRSGYSLSPLSLLSIAVGLLLGLVWIRTR